MFYHLTTNLNLKSSASKGLPLNHISNDSSKPPSSYEDFIKENMLKHSQEMNSGCDKNIFKNDCDSKNSDMNESDSESESEIDLTTTGSPKSFTLVNGCIDYSNNNNNSEK